MILPTKHLSPERALLVVSGNVLKHLHEEKTISRLWNDVKRSTANKQISYDWFILSLDLLHTLNLIELQNGRLRKVAQ